MDLFTFSVGGSMTVGLVGLIWGYVADRIGARWPAHPDRRIRPLDWRTFAVVVLAGLGFALLGARVHSPGLLLILGAYLGALAVLLATDLDQRLLPDVITLPLIACAGLIDLADLNPLVRGQLVQAFIAAAAAPAVLFLLSIPFGKGAIGQGDLKLIVSVGLLAGWERTILALIAASLASGLVIGLLLVSRRVTLRTYVPFGPFLIVGAVLGLLAGP